MRFLKSLVASVWLLISVQPVAASAHSNLGWKPGWRPSPSNQTDSLAAQGLFKLALSFAEKGGYGNCSLEKVAMRREWSLLKPRDRKAYTDAVICLMSKPSRLSALTATLVPGAKTRYDDFVAVHINNTLTIHATANFLSWHRLFVWLYETTLREECGYKGYQPYWNWAKTSEDPVNSPMFDGSPYSMGGNGVYEAHNCTNALFSTANPPVGCIPPGEGGGCVEYGPFKNYTVNLSPIAPALSEPEINATLPMFSYSPRCMKRDISPWVSQQSTRDQHIYELITKNQDIEMFQAIMQGNGFPNGFYGVHAGGHYTLNGDPSGDFFSSPGDPAFFLHHAQIDRVWWIWQNLNLPLRQNAIAGTLTINNSPPSRNGTLGDWLEMGILGEGESVGEEKWTIADVMSTIGGGQGGKVGPLCYIYVWGVRWRCVEDGLEIDGLVMCICMLELMFTRLIIVGDGSTCRKIL